MFAHTAGLDVVAGKSIDIETCGSPGSARDARAQYKVAAQRTDAEFLAVGPTVDPSTTDQIVIDGRTFQFFGARAIRPGSTVLP